MAKVARQTNLNKRGRIESSQPNRKIPKIFCGVVLALAMTAWWLSGGFCSLSNHFAAGAIRERDFDSARSWLQSTKRLQPTNAYALFLAARMARLSDDFRALENLLDAAERNGMEADRVLLERQLSQAQRGFLDEVEHKLTARLLSGDRELAEICEAYAKGLAKESRFDAALEVLRAWHADRPDTPIPLYRIGRIEEFLQQFDKAKSSYRAAIAKDKEFFPAMFGLARRCLADNEAVESRQLYNRCLLMPKPAAAKIGIALSDIKLGNFESAKTLLQEVSGLGSEAARLSYVSVDAPYERFIAASELGTLLANEGLFEQSLGYLDSALNENPRDVSARYSRGLALRGLNRDEEADKEFVYVAEAKNAFQKVSSLTEKINRSNDDVESRIEVGKLLVQYESERTGLFWLRSALAYKENNAKVHEALAEFYESHLGLDPNNVRLSKFHRDRFLALQKVN